MCIRHEPRCQRQATRSRKSVPAGGCPAVARPVSAIDVGSGAVGGGKALGRVDLRRGRVGHAALLCRRVSGCRADRPTGVQCGPGGGPPGVVRDRVPFRVGQGADCGQAGPGPPSGQLGPRQVRWRRDAASVAGLGTFDFFDIGCFQGLAGGQRLAEGEGVSALASPGATLLMLSFGTSRYRALVGGVSQEDVEPAFRGWDMLAVEPAGDAADSPR
jgi:hypothetical protein